MNSAEGSVITVLVVMVVVALILLATSVKVVAEYQRGVIFRLGRLMEARGPGLFFIIPIIERMVRVDLRVITHTVPAQEVITRDNVTIRVNAVLYFRIVDPNQAVTAIVDYQAATSQIAQTSLRNVVGQSHLDELLAEREQINGRLQQIIDEQTEPWGVKVNLVEVKDVELPETMQRAMARQAEAERERRAKVINAEGELQASEKLAQAARVLAEVPATMQLRYLQTLTEIATEQNSTIVFPIPIELLSSLMSRFVPTPQDAGAAPPTAAGPGAT